MVLFAKYTEALFERGKRLHLYTSLALLVLILLVLGISHNWNYTATCLFIYFFTLGCLYTGRWICRRWLLINSWVSLISNVIISLIVAAVIGTTGFVYFFNPVMPLNHVLESAINISVLSFLLIFCGFFIAVTRTAIREKLKGLVLAEQNKESELSLLRSQVSPHFLFNTLNNMYSLSINKPAQMPPLLLKLSELLRYSVYEADQALVTLQEEIEYIRNYIALENIRLSDRLRLTAAMDDNPEGIRIAPMLLIVFIENAFKHARNTTEPQIFINLSLKTEQDKIYFNIENSCGEVLAAEPVKRHSGFGIVNVVKRLELLYLGAYGLMQSHTQDRFKLELWLKRK